MYQLYLPTTMCILPMGTLPTPLPSHPMASLPNIIMDTPIFGSPYNGGYLPKSYGTYRLLRPAPVAGVSGTTYAPAY